MGIWGTTWGRWLGIAILVVGLQECTCGVEGEPCTAGSFKACPCAEGVDGWQLCDEDGLGYLDCACTLGDVPVDLAAAPVSQLFNADNMVPGDVLRGTVRITNSGGQSMRYSATSQTSENTLAGQLDLTISPTSSDSCDDVSDDAIYDGGPLGDTLSINVIGDPAVGGQDGDRTLGDGANEFLCFEVELPLDTGNEFQGLGTGAVFTFSAEQIGGIEE